jgi:hypothetical protein
VFENRVLRRMSGSKRDKAKEGWRIIKWNNRIIKWRRIKWAGPVARMEGRVTRNGYWWENQRGKRLL